jgi:RimJ/RimL family protein N-acetyltransferase
MKDEEILHCAVDLLRGLIVNSRSIRFRNKKDLPMTQPTNLLNQPIGLDLSHWTPPQWPARQSIAGRFCRLEPLNAEIHAADLFAANAPDQTGSSWTYLPYGPFESFADYKTWVKTWSEDRETVFFAIIDSESKKAVGVASYLRIAPESGSIEIGHLHFSEALKNKPAATEAMFLLMRNIFMLGYRRYEWKCNALNAASRRAAQRLGFMYEGNFRQATVMKGRSRDTTWFSIIDSEWPMLEKAFLQWLAPENFDASGQQKLRLSQLISTIPR